METDAGDWTNLSFEEVRAREPERFEQFVTVDPAFAFPGGESFAEQDVRVAAAIADVEARRAAGAGGVPRDGDPRRPHHPRRAPVETIKRVANGALVPLDLEAAEQADLGGGAATLAT